MTFQPLTVDTDSFFNKDQGLEGEDLVFSAYQDLTLDQEVMLVIDADQFNDAFFDDLISRVNVTVVSAQELMD